MNSVFRTLLVVASALVVSGCAEDRSDQERDLSVCVRSIDHSVTYALRARANELEHTFNKMIDDILRRDPDYEVDRSTISVKNVAAKYGTMGGESIFANPLSTSMSLAASLTWKGDKVALPKWPNLLLDPEQLSDSEKTHLSMAFGWDVQAESVQFSNGRTVLKCTYTADAGSNPWRNFSLTARLQRMWHSFVQQGDRLTVVAFIGTHLESSYFEGWSAPVDHVLMRMMDSRTKDFPGEFYPSVVASKDAILNARSLAVEEAAFFHRNSLQRGQRFWFEFLSEEEMK